MKFRVRFHNWDFLFALGGSCQFTDICSTIQALCVVLLGIWCMLDKYDSYASIIHSISNKNWETNYTVISHFRGLSFISATYRTCLSSGSPQNAVPFRLFSLMQLWYHHRVQISTILTTYCSHSSRVFLRHITEWNKMETSENLW